MNSLVSIIIPVYNTGRYLKEAVDSAVNQIYKNKEIIVVDDGSTDNTKKVVEPYLNSGKMKYIYQENKGVAGARNTGIKAAKGEFIAFLDSDDIFLPDKIEKQVEILKNAPDFDIVCCVTGHFFDDDKENIRTFKNKPITDDQLKNLSKGNFININTALVRRGIVEKILFDENLRTSEDWDFWIRVHLSGHKFLFHDDVLVLTRIRKDSLQSNFVLQKKNDIHVLKKNFEKVPLKFYIKLGFSYLLFIFPKSIRKKFINFLRYYIKYEHS